MSKKMEHLIGPLVSPQIRQHQVRIGCFVSGQNCFGRKVRLNISARMPLNRSAYILIFDLTNINIKKYYYIN